MARRRKRQEDHVNHERWIVSYADFITLLFAFFVVMYSISSVNEGKYRVLSQTLTHAFQESARSMKPIQVGEAQQSSSETAGEERQSAMIPTEVRMGPGTYQDSGSGSKQDDKTIAQMPSDEGQRLKFLAATIENMLGAYVEQDLVDVTYTHNRVKVNMKDKMLFDSGSATLSEAAVKVLRDISQVLSKVPNQIQVEGNTDNRPIHTEEFPSNWELSAARAASVVHVMTRLGVDPSRMTAIGYGQYRPTADNDTDAGRAKNRRVTLVILGMNGKPDQSIDLPGGGQ